MFLRQVNIGTAAPKFSWPTELSRICINVNQWIYLFCFFYLQVVSVLRLQITPLLGLVLVGLRLAGRATWSLSSAKWQLLSTDIRCFRVRLGLNFSQNVAFGLVLPLIVVQVQYVKQFSKYELCCQYFCRSRESSLIPNYRSGSGSHVMRNPALWLVEMHSGLVVNVSDWSGYINPPRSLVGNTTFECPFEYTSEQTILPESKFSPFLPRYGVKTGQ